MSWPLDMVWDTPLQTRPNFKNFPSVCPKLVPGMDVPGPSGHPWTDCPLSPNLKFFQVQNPSPLQSPKEGQNPSQSTFWDWTGSQTGWGHWTNCPSLGPVLRSSPSPCPEAWDRYWDQNPLHSRLAQILEIVHGSVPSWSQVPGTDVPGPSQCPEAWDRHLDPKSTPLQASPNFGNFPRVCPKLVPGPRDGRPWSQRPAGDRMSTLDKFEIFLSPES